MLLVSDNYSETPPSYLRKHFAISTFRELSYIGHALSGVKRMGELGRGAVALRDVVVSAGMVV